MPTPNFEEIEEKDEFSGKVTTYKEMREEHGRYSLNLPIGVNIISKDVMRLVGKLEDDFYSTDEKEVIRKELKKLLWQSLHQVAAQSYNQGVEDCIEVAFDASDIISKLYNEALREMRQDEANGYAHSLAIVKEVVAKLTNLKGTDNTPIKK